MSTPPLIESYIKLSGSSGIENIRILVSTRLTEILMLYGRLYDHHNTRYLPTTVGSILVLIADLEHLEKKHRGFSDILAENIERREKYSNVFHIPEALTTNPTVKGLREALTELMAPLLSSYCSEDKKFLENIGPTISNKTKCALFQRTIKNCEVLQEFCLSGSSNDIEELKTWCTDELKKLN